MDWPRALIEGLVFVVTAYGPLVALSAIPWTLHRLWKRAQLRAIRTAPVR